MKNKNDDFMRELMQKMSRLNSKSVMADLMKRAPDDPEAVAKMLADVEANLGGLGELEVDLETDGDDVTALPPYSAPTHKPAASCATGTKHTTIRLSNRVRAAFEVRARATGIGYQTLINRTLKAAMASWDTPGSPL